MEQRAYDGLKLKWPQLPGQVRAYCDKAVGFSGASYWLLGICVDMELRAINSQTDQHFKF